MYKILIEIRYQKNKLEIKMSKNVFILGAGTSKHTGAPLMNNFLDVAEDLLK